MERKSFQTEMEVTGRISVEPTEDLRSTRLKSVSTEDMQKELSKLKDDQSMDIILLQQPIKNRFLRNMNF